MTDRTKLPNILVELDQDGVRTTPRIRMIESKLGLLAKTFTGEDPWRLVILPNGEIDEVVGFTGNELQVGDIVGPAVLEFMNQVDPHGDNIYVMMVLATAQAIAKYEIPVGEIDWNLVHYKFVYPYRGMAGFLGSEDFSLLILPGAPYGPYRDDVNAYLRSIFLDELHRAYKRSVVQRFLDAGSDLLEALDELDLVGVSGPESMQAFIEDLSGASDEDGDLTLPGAEAIYGGYFGEVFPEFAVPNAEDEGTNRIIQVHCEGCGQEGLAGTQCVKCGEELPSEEDVLAEARGDIPDPEPAAAEDASSVTDASVNTDKGGDTPPGDEKDRADPQ